VFSFFKIFAPPLKVSLELMLNLIVPLFFKRASFV